MQDFVDNKGFLYKFDISQGYHHIDIDENHQKYLGLSQKIDGIIRYFMFTVLPFGLCSATFIFTKVLYSLVKFWRREGIEICVYIDDGLGASPSLGGFITNSEKSVWQPQKELTWLGIKINLINSRFTIPENRILSILESIQVAIKIYHIQLLEICLNYVEKSFLLNSCWETLHN